MCVHEHTYTHFFFKALFSNGACKLTPRSLDGPKGSSPQSCLTKEDIHQQPVTVNRTHLPRDLEQVTFTPENKSPILYLHIERLENDIWLRVQILWEAEKQRWIKWAICYRSHLPEKTLSLGEGEERREQWKDCPPQGPSASDTKGHPMNLLHWSLTKNSPWIPLLKVLVSPQIDFIYENISFWNVCFTLSLSSQLEKKALTGEAMEMYFLGPRGGHVS